MKFRPKQSFRELLMLKLITGVVLRTTAIMHEVFLEMLQEAVEYTLG
jgi:hypothetical protein